MRTYATIRRAYTRTTRIYARMGAEPLGSGNANVTWPALPRPNGRNVTYARIRFSARLSKTRETLSLLSVKEKRVKLNGILSIEYRIKIVLKKS